MRKFLSINLLLLSLILTSCGGKIPTEVNFILTDLSASIVDIHTDEQAAYCADESPDHYINQHKYDLATYSKSAPKAVSFSWTCESDTGTKPSKYALILSEDNIFDENDEPLISKKTSLDVYNLKIDTTYYWKVKAIYGSSEFSSEASSFTTISNGPRNIFVEGMENVRDLGGWDVGENQRYRQGLIYRSAELNGDEDGLSAPSKNGKKVLLEQLKIKSEIDVRKTLAANGEDEVCGITASPLGKTVDYLSYPMIFGGTNVISNPNNKTSLVNFFTYLSESSHYPVIFHCVRGTDRTGALAYVLGALCGMNETQLLADYLFSNFANINSAAIRESNISGTAYYPAQIDNCEGDSLSKKAENYLISTLDISAEIITKIKNILVETVA